MDAGFYRGTNADQDNRFTDKEKKLLKQMKFESVLDTKVDLSKVNIDVIKPWITAKLNELLGIEDDVLVEYVFTQLEDKALNPKVMQINLTGFLNARISREFVAEMWQMFIEAASSPDGIPLSIVEKKMEQIKAAAARDGGKDNSKSSEQQSSSLARATVVDWKHRYQSLTGGRYGKDNYAYDNGSGGVRGCEDGNVGGDRKENGVSRRPDRDDRSPFYRGGRRSDVDRRRDRSRDRGGSRERRVDRERDRDRDRSYRDRNEAPRRQRSSRRSRSSSGSASPPPVRRFTEDPSSERPEKPTTLKEKSKKARKKRKRKSRHHDSDSETEAKKSKKHKKEKKKKHRKEKD